MIGIKIEYSKLKTKESIFTNFGLKFEKIIPIVTNKKTNKAIIIEIVIYF